MDTVLTGTLPVIINETLILALIAAHLSTEIVLKVSV